MKLYDFGKAPEAKTDGFGRILTTFRGTEKEACIAYLNSNVALVRGPSLQGQPDSFEFAVMDGSPRTRELTSAELKITIQPETPDPEFSRSDEIKAEYLSSGCQASDVYEAFGKLMAECGSLFENDRHAWSFLMEESHEDLEQERG